LAAEIHEFEAHASLALHIVEHTSDLIEAKICASKSLAVTILWIPPG
jgi:hypothetical protein